MANVRFAIFSAGSTSSTPSFDPSRKDGQGGGGMGRGKEEEDGVEDATLRDSNDPTNNNTKSFRKYRNTKFHRSFVPPSASLFPLTLVSVSLRYYIYVRTYFFLF